MMDSNGKTGRQEVIAAYHEFDIEDFKDSAGNLLTTPVAVEKFFPANTCVLRGFIVLDTAFNGTTPTIDIGDNSESTPDPDKYLDGGSLATANTAVALTNATGYEIPAGCDLTMKLNAGDSTVGAGRICVEYVVRGRSAFSQG